MDYRILGLTIVIILAIGLVVPMALAGPSSKATKACNDGFDNDDDGYTDWPDDPGCQNKNDDSELNPAIECDDGTDNDGDNDIDMADSGCSSPTDDDETDCGDGVCEGGETSGTCPEDCGYPDSCSDTDGGNYKFLFGTTSGYLNDIYYSNDDYCVDSSNVMEYYCSGDYEQSQQHSCGTDGYGSPYCTGSSVYIDYNDYFCLSGECDSTSTPEFQEDCDDYDGYGQYYCNGTFLYRYYNDYYCTSGDCEFAQLPEFVEYCEYGCINATCMGP